MTFRIRNVEAFGGKQMILWLEDEMTHADGPGDGSQWCVRLTIDEAPSVLQNLMRAYAETMQGLVIELGAGGCRTCGNARRVITGHDGKLRGYISIVDALEDAQPCPTCIPRAETRIRRAAMLRAKEKR